jgi:hypothetical protein
MLTEYQGFPVRNIFLNLRNNTHGIICAPAKHPCPYCHGVRLNTFNRLKNVIQACSADQYRERKGRTHRSQQGLTYQSASSADPSANLPAALPIPLPLRPQIQPPSSTSHANG